MSGSIRRIAIINPIISTLYITPSTFYCTAYNFILAGLSLRAYALSRFEAA